jgi:hypothetical protein
VPRLTANDLIGRGMARRALLSGGLLASCFDARQSRAQDEGPFTRAPGFPFRGPRGSKGALVWLPGTPGKDQDGPPPPPDFVGREAGLGLDIWLFNRPPKNDPLDEGAATLATGVGSLRDMGYRRVLVAGHSRGAWIALTILSHHGLADGVAAFSPAAHGTQKGNRPKAMSDWADLWHGIEDDGTPVVLVQLKDDPWDPDPTGRLAIARGRLTGRLLSIFQPDKPTGHSGVYDPLFDERFGADIVDFLR